MLQPIFKQLCYQNSRVEFVCIPDYIDNDYIIINRLEIHTIGFIGNNTSL